MTVSEVSRRLGISTPTVTQRARALLAEGKISPREGRDWIFSPAEAAMLRDFSGRPRERKKPIRQPAAAPAPPARTGTRGYGIGPRRYAEGAEDVPRGE